MKTERSNAGANCAVFGQRRRQRSGGGWPGQEDEYALQAVSGGAASQAQAVSGCKLAGKQLSGRKAVLQRRGILLPSNQQLVPQEWQAEGVHPLLQAGL